MMMMMMSCKKQRAPPSATSPSDLHQKLLTPYSTAVRSSQTTRKSLGTVTLIARGDRFPAPVTFPPRWGVGWGIGDAIYLPWCLLHAWDGLHQILCATSFHVCN